MEAPQQEASARAPSPDIAYRGLSVGMEEQLYRLLGRLLGTLEAMATAVEDPLQGRQRQWVQDALESGHDLKEHIEAAALLAAPDPQERLTRAPYSVRRMVEHAVRAAGWLAGDRGVSLVLPRLEAWSERTVNADVRAVDRVIRGLCEQLLVGVQAGGSVEVSLSAVGAELRLGFVAHGPVELERPEVSELLVSAWKYIASLHGGHVALDLAQGSAELRLPLCAG